MMGFPKLLRTLGPMLVAGALVALLAGGFELAAQRTLTVCPSGCEFAAIQAAIDAARPGDTIEVQAGTYRENLTIRNKRDLTLQGVGRDQVTLDGSAAVGWEEIVPGVLIEEGQNITIQGFRIVGSRRGLEALDVTGLVIAENLFEDNLRQGITLSSTGAPVKQAQLLDNIVRNTQPDRDGAFGIGVDVFGSQAVLERNTIEGSADCGLRVTHSGEVAGSDNVIQNNKGGDLCGTVPLTLLREPPPEGTLDTVAVPQDVSTLQEALSQVKSGGTITVAAGTYRGQLQIYKSVIIRGTGSDQTILQAPGPGWTAINVATDQLEVVLEELEVTGGRRGVQIDTGPNGAVTLRNVNVESNGASGATDAGILIFGQGKVRLEQVRISENRGLGLWASGMPKVTVQNSTILQNESIGVHFDGKADVSLQNSTISQNSQNGLQALDDTQVTLEAITLSGNGAHGLFLDGHAVVSSEESTFSRNGRSGIWAQGDAQLSARGSTVADNELGGIVIRGNASGTVAGGTVTRNREEGIWVGDSAQATLREVRVTANRKDTRGQFGEGLIVAGNAKVTIQESTIDRNPDHGIIVDQNAQAAIEGSTVADNTVRGIGLFSRARAAIRESTITNNRGFSGIVLADNSQATIKESTISRNVESGIFVGWSAQATIRDNRITDNRANAQGYFGWGIALRAGARVTIEGNTISGHPLSGIAVGAPDLDNEAVRAEISQNRIQNNQECGVWADNDPGIRITGRGNTITGNRLGDLCGDLNKFPQGFGGGK